MEREIVNDELPLQPEVSYTNRKTIVLIVEAKRIHLNSYQLVYCQREDSLLKNTGPVSLNTNK